MCICRYSAAAASVAAVADAAAEAIAAAAMIDAASAATDAEFLWVAVTAASAFAAWAEARGPVSSDSGSYMGINGSVYGSNYWRDYSIAFDSISLQGEAKAMWNNILRRWKLAC